MPKKISIRKCGIAALAFGLVVSAAPAYAGFQWVTPPDQAAQTYAAPSSSATSAPEIVSPVVITGDSGPAMQPAPASTYYPAPTYQQVAPQTYAPRTYASPAPAQIPVQAPSSQAPSQTYAPAPAQQPANLATATIAMPPAGAGDVVQGFGTQIPLALALRQILPVGYNFTIDQNIDMDTLVSYQGGKSWRETIRDMLRPVGLTAHEQGMTLTIDRNAAASAPPPVAPAPEPIQDITPPPAMSRMAQMSPAPHLADVPSMNVGSPDGWSAERGDTLRKVLTDWCRRAGVELQWIAEYDYPMEASAHFNGGFEDAVRGLLGGFENARPQPVAELHTNTGAGQMLLVVQARGNSYSN